MDRMSQDWCGFKCLNIVFDVQSEQENEILKLAEEAVASPGINKLKKILHKLMKLVMI